MITEQECRRGLLPEFAIYAGAGVKSFKFYLGQELHQESTLRSVQEPINIFQGTIKISVSDICYGPTELNYLQRVFYTTSALSYGTEM